MAEIPFEGFQVDDTKARAMAEGLDAALTIARAAEHRIAEELAALGIVAARVILRSKIQRSPEQVLRAWADYTAAQVRAMAAAGGQGS